MARKNSLQTMPEDVQEQFHSLVRAGHTIDDIRAALAALGHEKSRSAVGRAVLTASRSLERYKLAQATAKVWVDKMEADPAGDVGRLLPQMLSAVAYKTLETIGEADEAVDSKELATLAKALSDLSKADRTRITIEQELRHIRAEAIASAEAVGKDMKAAGLSEEAVRLARERILGIAG